MSGDDGSALARLSADDVEVVRQCLDAAVRGPFFPDSEFSLLMSLERDEVAAILASWPDPKTPERQSVAVNNVLNWLLGYPHRKWGSWDEFVAVPPDEVAAVLTRWRGEPAFDPTARGFFDRAQ